jgi:malonyl-CoA O-methyltransferase
VDKIRVRRAFSRGAAEYDAHAVVQRRAMDRLLELALPAVPVPRRVLDVGAGTGTLLARIAAIFPGALLAGVDLAAGMARTAQRRSAHAHFSVGDAEGLPFSTGAFDLVLSSSTLQWLPRLEPALAEARRVLSPGGVVAIALFGGATLHELHGAWREALPGGAPDRCHHFHGERDVAAALGGAGLAADTLTSERIVEHHAHPLALLHALKRIGAGNAAAETGQAGSPCGLGARGTLERMARVYQARHGGPDGVAATWDVLYAVAHRP